METMAHEVQRVFAELTRYPLDVLDFEADLEEDLGIDSVKRAEILSAFQERYELPDDLDVPASQLTTIAKIAEVLETITKGWLKPRGKFSPIGGSGAAPSASGRGLAGEAATQLEVPGAPNSPAPTVRSSADRVEIERLVVDTLAEVTRYPKDILSLDAAVEEDLGIDSVKLAEVVAVLQERLGLAVASDQEPPRIVTIEDIVSATLRFLESAGNGASAGREAVAGNGASAKAEATANVAAGVTTPRDSSWFLGHRWPFAGKIALVTGSGHGIGREIALELAGLGATVVVNSFHSRARGERTAEEIRNEGGRAHHVWASVANTVQLERLFQEIEQRLGGLDFFVSNASNGMIAPLTDITDVHWERAFRTNVIALHRGALLAARLMAPRGGGKIVTISSPGAHRYIRHFGCMGPVKAALESLTRYLAIELAPQNIQVNAVSAGPIYGELLSKYPDGDRLIHHWEALSAGHRLGEERDVASFVAYLLSKSADKITGSVLLVDSGGSQRIDL
jgi:enoyl-[acyl-carrier protein] reductase III